MAARNTLTHTPTGQNEIATGRASELVTLGVVQETEAHGHLTPCPPLLIKEMGH
jgi:hypothetical protein